MNKQQSIENCKQIFDSCWNNMHSNRTDWKKALDAFGSVCERSGNDYDVTGFAVKCVELLEIKLKGDTV